jgi:cadmium resistance transport/sequestration family protein
MTWFVSALLIGIVTFAITNIDDIFVLAIFFAQSQANPALKKRQVVMGQYLGFSVLVLASLLVVLTSLVIPLAWIGLLGLIPFGQGLFRLIKLFGKRHQADEQGDESQQREPNHDQEASVPRVLRPFLNPRIFSIATITISNGSDNISIYPPIFAHGGTGQLVIVLIVFFLMVALWCLSGYSLTRVPGVAQVLERYGSSLLPLCLMGLGVYILIQSGTVSLFASFIHH